MSVRNIRSAEVEEPEFPLSAGWVKITPDMARKMLARNKGNRPIKPNWVLALKRRMLRGEWGPSWDAIAVDSQGNVVNGQHRLLAIAESGLAQTLLLVTGIPETAADAGDGGVKRSVADSLTRYGEKDAKHLTAIIRPFEAYLRTGRPIATNKYELTVPLARTVLAEHPRIREAIDVAKGFGRVFRRMAPALFGSLWYLFSLVDAEDAEAFIAGVIGGEGLVLGDPRLALRTRLLSESTQQTTRLSDLVLATFTIRAWNAWRRGEKLSKMQFQPSAPFPVIEGLTYEMVA